eukprot:TRINITY_DN30784_c0_g1_i1.p1 TRINITY_DN30784_c0_g1~~TRINITY_DN30784_c0_g1_i1.p1  ORF type:complete len:1207 (+),score=271.48 TRINITY_DN30784_c0_g1_i1:141-3761(+)
MEVCSSASVQLQAADGAVFRIPVEVARLSPLLADILENEACEDEVPVPTLKKRALGRLLRQLEGKAAGDEWQTQQLGEDESEVEELLWAADYFGLDELMMQCMTTLVAMLACKAPSDCRVSKKTLRRLLETPMRISEACLKTLLRALALNCMPKQPDVLETISRYTEHTTGCIRAVAAAALGEAACKQQPPQPLLPDAAVAGQQADEAIDEVKAARERLCRLMEDDMEKEVRLSAFVGYIGMAEKGDEEASEQIQRKINDTDPEWRRLGIEMLCRVAPIDHTQTLVTMSNKLKDPASVVRCAALDAMVRLSVQGDRKCIASIGTCLEDSEESIRMAAVEALAKVAGCKGDCVAIAVAACRLDHRFWWVRRAAVRALHVLAERGDPQATAAVVARLTHQEEGVRLAALEVLPQVVHRGDIQVVSAVWALVDRHVRHVKPTTPNDASVLKAAMQCLAHLSAGGRQRTRAILAPRHGCVRGLSQATETAKRAAVNSLAFLADQGDDRAVAVACEHLEHGDATTRAEALASLERLSRRGKERVMRSLKKRKLTPTEALQRASKAAALAALDELVGAAERSAVAIMARLIKHKDPYVRRAAVVGIAYVAEPGTKQVAADLGQHMAQDALAKLLRDKNPRVRHPVFLTVAQVAELGDGRVIAEVGQQLAHENGDVRSAATSELIKWATGDVTGGPAADASAAAAAFACANLNHPDASVRGSAMEVLKKASQPGDLSIVAAVAPRLTDKDYSIRRAAVKTLGRIADRGCEKVLTLIGQCLCDKHVTVRRAAVEAFSEVAMEGSAVAVREAVTRLDNKHSVVRWTAVAALLNVSDVLPVDEATRLLQPYLEHRSGSVRHVAGYALKALTDADAEDEDAHNLTAERVVDFAFLACDRLWFKEKKKAQLARALPSPSDTMSVRSGVSQGSSGASPTAGGILSFTPTSPFGLLSSISGSSLLSSGSNSGGAPSRGRSNSGGASSRVRSGSGTVSTRVPTDSTSPTRASSSVRLDCQSPRPRGRSPARKSTMASPRFSSPRLSSPRISHSPRIMEVDPLEPRLMLGSSPGKGSSSNCFGLKPPGPDRQRPSGMEGSPGKVPVLCLSPSKRSVAVRLDSLSPQKIWKSPAKTTSPRLGFSPRLMELDLDSLPLAPSPLQSPSASSARSTSPGTPAPPRLNLPPPVPACLLQAVAQKKRPAEDFLEGASPKRLATRVGGC